MDVRSEQVAVLAEWVAGLVRELARRDDEAEQAALGAELGLDDGVFDVGAESPADGASALAQRCDDSRALLSEKEARLAKVSRLLDEQGRALASEQARRRDLHASLSRANEERDRLLTAERDRASRDYATARAHERTTLRLEGACRRLEAIVEFSCDLDDVLHTSYTGDEKVSKVMAMLGEMRERDRALEHDLKRRLDDHDDIPF